MDILLNIIESEDPLYIENFEQLISNEKTLETEKFMIKRINDQAHVTDGEILLRSLKIPYLKMPVPPAPWDDMLVEAINVAPRFVSHRSNDSKGWKSVCLHGLSAEKTMAPDRYGFDSEKNTPYVWTDVAAQCPRTVSWLQQLLDEKYFNEFYRVRYMWLEPGGYIEFHRDRNEGENSLGPLNVALNMPDACHWLFKEWGKVPFYPGAAICVDISNMHSVVNLSNEARIHIIIHGCYGPRYYESLVAGAKQYKALATLKTDIIPPVDVDSGPKPVKADFVLWSYMNSSVDPVLRRKSTELTLHQMRLNSFRITHFMEDHSLSRLFERSLARGSKWCVVQTPGTVLKPGIYQETEKMLQEAPSKAFFFGHLLDRGERGYGFHEQFFAVDVQKWDEMGRPPIGWPENSARFTTAADRSPENVHDDYTPFWLKPTSKTLQLTPGVMGWNMISAALKAGYECYNLPNNVRSKKSFTYPEQNSKALCSCLNRISEPFDSLKELTSQLTKHQYEVFDYLHAEADGFGSKIFVFNTESYNEVVEQGNKRPLDGLYSVSAGFKDILILQQHGFNPGCFVTYLDISPQALFFKEYLYKNWDGRNFPAFFDHVHSLKLKELEDAVFAGRKSDLTDSWENELNAWGGADKFAKAYEMVRHLPRRYVVSNFIADPYFLARDMREQSGKNFVVWYSNCFNYTPGFVSENWDMRKIENSGICMLSGLREVALQKNKNIIYYGEDVVWGSRKFRWNNNASAFFT